MVRRVLAGCVVALVVSAAPVKAQIQSVPLRVNPIADRPIMQEGTPVTTIRLGEPQVAAPRPFPDSAIRQASFNGAVATPEAPRAAPDATSLPPVPAPFIPSVPTADAPPGQNVILPQPGGQNVSSAPFPGPPTTPSPFNGPNGIPVPGAPNPGPQGPPTVFNGPNGAPVTGAPFPGPQTAPSPFNGPNGTPAPFNAPVMTTISANSPFVGATPLAMPQQIETPPLETQQPQPVERFTIATPDDACKLTLFGTLRADMIFSTALPVSPGTPFFLAPDSPFDLDQDTVDIHARASTFGVVVSGPDVCGFKSGGLVLLLFYNDSLIADRYGVLPYQLWGDLKNDNWRFAAGFQRDLFNPVDPTTLAFSRLYGSGNTGNYRGQFRVERFVHLGEDMQVTCQAGLSEPVATFVTDAFRVSEDNGWPNIEGRVALGLGPVICDGLASCRPFEIGASGIVGELRTTPTSGKRVVTDVWGLGADLRWRINERYGVQGECYTGQALGTYNGGALQTISFATLDGVRSSGAWGEFYYFLSPSVHTHLGYGIDDADDDDPDAPPAILRNETYFANIIWDVTRHFRVGFETTWRRTAFPSPLTNQGATFHTMVQWSF